MEKIRMDLHKLTLNQQLEGLKKGDFSSIDLTSHYLARISDYDEQLNSFITVTEDQALTQAKACLLYTSPSPRDPH